MASPPVCLLDHHLLLLPLHKDQPKRRDRKQNRVHDPKRECRLKHSTLLIEVEIETIITAHSVGAQCDVERSIIGEARTVGVGDAAEVIDSGDQGADEANVDKADEVGGSAGRLAADYRQEAPCYGEGGDYEEDSDVSLDIWLRII